ncbi:MAG: thiamine-phosphate kinase [Fibrobacteres bacterium]|nr:thiamine-phosphate kinase [Fibrobacterota bacterium]
MKKKGEFQLIGEISRFCSNLNGDDAAVISISSKKSLLVSTDSFNENVHFKREWSTFFDAGYKAAAGAISDIYAMGGECRHLFSAISLPSSMPGKNLFEFYRGMKSVADKNGVSIDGGDTVKSPSSHFSATITVAGFAPTGNIKRRSDAKVGDIVYLSAPVGLSKCGLMLLEGGIKNGQKGVLAALLKHRRPNPESLGIKLGAEKKVHAMIDVSDGLSSELWHIAEASSVRIDVDLKTVERLSQNLPDLPLKKKIDKLELVLRSGEEYALLFTAAPSWKNRYGCIPVGRVSKGTRSVYMASNGKNVLLEKGGFDHLR